jgi:hypothetical protein
MSVDWVAGWRGIRSFGVRYRLCAFTQSISCFLDASFSVDNIRVDSFQSLSNTFMKAYCSVLFSK